MGAVVRRAVLWLHSQMGVAGVALRQPTIRRRILIVTAGAFICLYSVAVLLYVMSAPDSGLNCPFDKVIRRVFEGYAPPGEEDGPRDGDTIVKLGGQDVDWQHLLRRLGDLEDE